MSLVHYGAMGRIREQSTGTLYIVGTPIGNLDDMSPRAREVLGRVQIIAAEDTRRIRGLLSPSAEPRPRIIAYHDHNERDAAPVLIERLRDGQDVALVCDAGMPLISDPGFSLVSTARAAGIAVVSIPGPSAITAALSVSGLATDRFVFEGFLPRRAGQRKERLAAMVDEPRTMVFFESVHRLQKSLAAMTEAFGDARPAVIARELTKLHETAYAGTLGELRDALGKDIPLLGEFVVLVAGQTDELRADDARVRRIYQVLSAELAPAVAVSLTAELAGISRNAVYRLTRVDSDK